MRMLRLREAGSYSHEDIIIQRYDWLLNWSMKLSGYDVQEAEDLVHDAFIQFTMSAPDLSSIQNLEGYLYGLLRNIHLSRMRKAHRFQSQPVALLDYDFAGTWLRSAPIDSLIQSRELLLAVCEYACSRKETSKAGSILILRFFHGYYPGEIARITLSPRRTVDDWMHIARKEAKVNLDRPPLCSGRPAVASGADFLDSLRQMIFRSRQGKCLGEKRLRNLYGDESGGSSSAPDGQERVIDRPTLAHIVSCRSCLELVNDILGIPPLSDRFPPDMLGNAVSAAKGKPGRSAIDRARITACRSLAREVYQHEPKQLIVAVNGFFAASETVTAEPCSRSLALNQAEKVSMVEVFSEQGVRLLSLQVEPPPDGDINQSAKVELSEGRFIRLSIGFAGPSPAVKTEFGYTTASAPAAVSARRSELHMVAPALEPAQVEPAAANPSILSRFWDAMLPAMLPWLRPGAVTAAISIALAVALIALHLRTTTVRAAELLDQAAVVEEKTSRQPDVAFHRRLILEERSLGASSPAVTRRIVVWANPAAGLRACRVYDEAGQFVAGEWAGGDGVHLVYRKGSRLETPAESGILAIIESGEIWRIALSAKDFLAIIGSPEGGSVEQQNSSYIIRYNFGEMSHLASASLVLTRSGLTPLEETLVVRSMGNLVQYRLVESSSETVPLRQARPSVFQPDPEIIGSGPRTLSKPQTPYTGPGSVAESPALDEGAFYALKLDAMYQLHHANACLNDQTSFARTADGKLRIQLLTESERRKSEAASALASLAANPQIKLEVGTFREAASKLPTPAADNTIVRRIEVDRGRIPVYEDLRNYFEAQAGGSLSESATDEKIERFASRILKHSRLALLHAWALEQHVQEAGASLGSERPSLLAAMMADHLKGIQNETGQLAAELRPVSIVSSSDHPPDAEPDLSAGNLSASVRALYELVLANEKTIRSGFSLSPSGQSLSSPIRNPQFWGSLRSAEAMASSMLERTR